MFVGGWEVNVSHHGHWGDGGSTCQVYSILKACICLYDLITVLLILSLVYDMNSGACVLWVYVWECFRSSKSLMMSAKATLTRYRAIILSREWVSDAYTSQGCSLIWLWYVLGVFTRFRGFIDQVQILVQVHHYYLSANLFWSYWNWVVPESGHWVDVKLLSLRN